ncbi:MAG: hypothetical protein Q7R97_00925 [Candidatus Daviesbacteria bacterium]|nr:hypothetical protein [Candidatus Daviesbacteria bacterium]
MRKVVSRQSSVVRLFVSVVVFLIAITYNLSPVFAAGATLSLSPATGTFNQGCSFSIDVLLDTGGIPTDGTDAILFYDPTRFTATKIRSGTIYSDYPGNTIDAQGGRISINGLSSVSSAFSGTGVLASIDFTVAVAAPASVTQIKFDFDPNNKAKTTDSNVVERTTVADVLNQVNNGNYTIGTGVCGAIVTPIITQPGGQGGTEIVVTKTPPQEEFPKTPPGAFEDTMVIIGVGTILIILGILGLAIL